MGANGYRTACKWLRGVDLNHRPLGYENRNLNNLQDAGGALSHCKQRKGTVIGHLMDMRNVKRQFLNARDTECLGIIETQQHVFGVLHR